MPEIDQKLSRTDRNLWNAIVSEAMAYMKYSAFVHQAMEEGHPEIAQVFQEVAGAENIHGISHLRVSGEVKSSIENLRTVIQGEAREISTRYPNFIRDALDDGRMDAAETFTLAMDRERHHLELFSRSLEALEAKLSLAKNADGDEDAASARVVEGPRSHIVLEPNVSPSYAAARKEVMGERWRIAATSRIREVVFGTQDGLISTLALVSALAVADIGNNAILVGGLAGALAGMISMATGAYLGSKAAQDVQKGEIAEEARELEDHPAEELAELVVLYQREGLSFDEARGVAEHISADKDLWLRTMVEKELGISPEITSRPTKDAITMGVAFIVGATIPILPYFFLDLIEVKVAIGASVAATLVGLFGLGVWKGRIVRQSPILQGLEVLVIGAVAAGLGIALGEGIPRLF